MRMRLRLFQDTGAYIERVFLRLTASLLRACPRIPGRWRLIFWIQPRLKRAFDGRPFPACVRMGCGYKINVDLQDHVGRHIFTTGDYEPDNTKVFKSLLRPGDSVLDIGANIGYFTLLSRSLVGYAGTVYSFEASSSIMALLKKNIRLNEITNIETYHNAVVERERMLTFYESSEAHLGISSIRAASAPNCKAYSIRGVSIDSLADRLKKISLIKLDIEGAEYLALRGCDGLIRRDRPYIVMELTDGFLHEMGTSGSDILDFLRRRKYACYRNTWHGLEILDGAPPDQCNILAVPEEKEKDFRGRNCNVRTVLK